MLVFDIETCRHPKAAEWIEVGNPPKNYTKPDSISKWIEEERADQLDGAGKDPDLCRIVAIGWAFNLDLPTIWTAKDEDEEAAILLDFWTEWSASKQWCGYNCVGFDLQVLVRRSEDLGIAHPDGLTSKYRSPVIDLMMRQSFDGTRKFRKLGWWAKRYGIPHDDSVTGKDIQRLVDDGNWDAIIKHCGGDVQTTQALARRLNVL